MKSFSARAVNPRMRPAGVPAPAAANNPTPTTEVNTDDDTRDDQSAA